MQYTQSCSNEDFKNDFVMFLLIFKLAQKLFNYIMHIVVETCCNKLVNFKAMYCNSLLVEEFCVKNFSHKQNYKQILLDEKYFHNHLTSLA